MYKFKSSLLVVAGLIAAAMPLSVRANIKAANTYYQQEQYPQALKQYLLAARVGNVHAQCMLGTMYYQGQGTSVDKLEAVSWFILASENGHQDARNIARSLLAELSEEERAALNDAVSIQLSNFGPEAVRETFYPKVILANVAKRVSFGKPIELGTLELEMPVNIDSGINEDLIDLLADETDDDTAGLDLSLSADINALQEYLRDDSNYFLIGDFLLAEDGSLRSFSPLFQYGRWRSVIERVQKLHGQPAYFGDEPVVFPGRLMLGQAQMPLGLLSLRERFPRLYRGIRNNKSRAEKGSAHDKYIYALTLEYFQGLRRGDTEIVDLLTDAAEQGHDEAQFVLGMKLYREQMDPIAGVQWIAEAAKQGQVHAEYWLGQFFLISPWHEYDEKLAAFWFARAAKQGFVAAIRDLARLYLFSTDKSLSDDKKALDHISRIAESDADNPETLRILAWATKRNGQRNTAIKTLEKAIRLGDERGWNTNLWLDELNEWKGRGVVHSEELSPAHKFQ